MTVQLSVLIWTVICFCLLIVILHNLLFKPLFLVMDKRNEKIEEAKRKKLGEQKALEERLAAEQSMREKTAKLDSERCAKRIAEAHSSAERLVRTAKAEQYRLTDARSAELNAQINTLGEELDKGVDSLASAYISKLLS